MPINSINTNVGALVALQSLNNTNNQLDSTQKRISTGFRVADNVDDGAAFAVAQGLRSDVKGFEAVNTQLNQSKGILSVASEAATKISDTLADIESVLVKLSDGGVTGEQRTQLEGDFDALTADIDNFIQSASFNGINLIESGAANVDVVSTNEGDTITITAQDVSTITSADLTAAPTDAAAAQTLLAGGFDTAETTIGNALAQLGQDTRRIDNQVGFINVLRDATEVGIGDIVDADLAKESAKLQSLQIKQQLGTQALGIANNSPSILLGLFN